MPILLKVINRANRLTGVLAGVLTAIIGVVVCYAVIFRYVFHQPIGWSEEISTYLMVWAAFLGAGYTMQVDGHVGVDLICRKFSSRVQAWLNIAKYIVGLAFLFLLIVKGIDECLMSVELNEVSISELAIPMYIPQLALPVGAALVALQLVEKLIAQLTGQTKCREDGQ